MHVVSNIINLAQSFIVRVIILTLGRHHNAINARPVTLSLDNSRVLFFLSKDMFSISVKSPAQQISLGRAHAMLLDLRDVRCLTEPTTPITIHLDQAQAPIITIDAVSGSLRAQFARVAYHLYAKNSSLLDIKREMAIEYSSDQFVPTQATPVTEPGDWPEKNARSIQSHIAHVLELAAQRQANERYSFEVPLISFVVPVFNARKDHLDELLRSFRLQPHSACELILSDDGSSSAETITWFDAHADIAGLSILRNPGPSGISGATNAGLAVARGDWVGFIDHDDALLPMSVGEIIRAIRDNPDCVFLYTDEIVTNENLIPVTYFLKPAWDPILLSGVNYINHLSLYKRDLLQRCGGLRGELDGSQDYDLLLRYTSRLTRSQIRHLPFPAYLWRRSKTTYSVRSLDKATRNARTALSERFSTDRKQLEVSGAIDENLHRVRFDRARDCWPKVSIVIPSRNAPALISRVLEGLFEQTDYPEIEVIVIDNGTTDPETLNIYDSYSARPNFHAFIEICDFNFSAAVNKGIGYATSDPVLLLNNDIEVLSRDWLKEMVCCLEYEDVGIVGAKLLYPNGKLQHAGVIAGLGQLAGHWFIEEDANFPGPMGRLWVRQTFSCVTGAAMLISRRCIEAVGSFDEQNFAIAYNDIDYCLRATYDGFRVAWTPFATLVHHESASRGSDELPDKIERFKREQANLQRIHGTDLLEDRAFNPWYSRMYSHPRYVYRHALADSR